MANTTRTGEFRTYTASEEKTTERKRSKDSLFSDLLNIALPNFSDMRPVLGKFAKNTLICAFLAISVFILRDIRIKEVSSDELVPSGESELIQDADIGKLQFISSVSEIAIPVDGTVEESFAENGEYSLIKSTAAEPVFALMDGKISKTGTDFIVIENKNGTQTTYSGVIPGLKAGTEVMGSEAIGQLCGNELMLKTVGGIGYMDSLAAPGELG